MQANDWIAQLGLIAHAEGGYFSQSYFADEAVQLPRFGSSRPASTCIYFLLQHPDFSAFHRLQADEVWHFYSGSPLTLWLISPAGQLSQLHLGRDPSLGQAFQQVVPHNHWFAATVDQPGSYSLVGCTMAPGFDYADFELARAQTLNGLYPQHQELISRLTRG